jgi:hypothetical protein
LPAWTSLPVKLANEIDCIHAVKLTVDFEFNSALRQSDLLAKLLSKGKTTTVPMPLEALVSEQFSLKAAPDYPLAAITAHADGLDAHEGYWLRADPVHLVLQRDSFSLSEPVPMLMTTEHAQLLMATLNSHFLSEGLEFIQGNSSWYLRLADDAQVQTNLPSVAIGKNIHGYMPQGAYAAKWRSMLNEVQMLLFEHPVNQLRESQGNLAVNSIWLSGGGYLPNQFNVQDVELILTDSPLSQGLAKLAGINWQKIPSDATSIIEHLQQHIRLHLTPDSDVNAWLNTFYQMIKERKIKQLALNIGFYDKCLVVEVTTWDLYRFWRSIKPVERFLA